MAPKISALMAVYNCERYLEETVISIQNQTFSDFEFVIVDDASTDGTAEILNEFAGCDKRIRIIKNDVNMKLPASLNRGLQECSAEWIARVDADDIYREDRFEKQLKYVKNHPEVGVLSCSYEIIDEKGNYLGFRKLPETDRQLRFELMFRNCICHSASFYRKNLIMRVGGYNENFWTAQDGDLWERLLQYANFANLSDPLIKVRYRLNSTVGSRGAAGKALGLSVHKRLLTQYISQDLKELEIDSARKIYCGETISENELPIGLNVIGECLRIVQKIEPIITQKEFTHNIARKLLMQLVVMNPCSIKMFLLLIAAAIHYEKSIVFTKEGLGYIASFVLPDKIFGKIKLASKFFSEQIILPKYSRKRNY